MQFPYFAPGYVASEYTEYSDLGYGYPKATALSWYADSVFGHTADEFSVSFKPAVSGRLWAVVTPVGKLRYFYDSGTTYRKATGMRRVLSGFDAVGLNERCRFVGEYFSVPNSTYADNHPWV